MQSRVRPSGHPLHPMLIAFTLGLFSTAGIFDLLHLLDRQGPWAYLAFYLIGAGLIAGLIAASVGIMDWLNIPAGTHAKQSGLIAALSNSAILVIFVLSWLMRHEIPAAPEGLALVLSFSGLIMALVGGWLGSDLALRVSVGIESDSALSASVSLTQITATGAGR